MIVKDLHRITDVTEAEYHARPSVSHSMLKYLPDEPEMYWASFVADPKPTWVAEREVTRAMELGTAFHSMLLEGKQPPVVPYYLLATNGAMSTKEAKAFKALHPDYLKEDEHASLDYAVKRCWRDPEIAAYLRTAGEVEIALEWTDEDTGTPCRGKIDKLCRFGDGYAILDVKFSGGCDRDWVEKKVAEMLYYRQAAFYCDAAAALCGEPIRTFAFLFVANTPPHNNGLWVLDMNDIDLGRRHNDAALVDLRRRRETDDWFVLSPPGGNAFSIAGSFAGKRLWDRETASANYAVDFAEFATTSLNGD
jgi:hypothetical protein